MRFQIFCYNYAILQECSKKGSFFSLDHLRLFDPGCKWSCPGLHAARSLAIFFSVALAKHETFLNILFFLKGPSTLPSIAARAFCNFTITFLYQFLGYSGSKIALAKFQSLLQMEVLRSEPGVWSKVHMVRVFLALSPGIYPESRGF